MIIALLITLGAFVFSLRFKPVQTYIAVKVSNYLSNKLNTKIGVKSLYIKPFTNLVLEGFYVLDLEKDTLLKTPELTVDYSDFSLMARDGITLKDVNLKNGKIFIKTYKDSTTNYGFLINYFSTPKNKDSVSKPFNLALNNIKLQNLEFKYINYLNLDPDRKGINYDDLYIRNLNADITAIDLKNHVFKGNINKLDFKEKSGFELNKLVGILTIDSNQIIVDRLNLITPTSRLNDRFSMKFERFADFKQAATKVTLEGNFVDSKINTKDIAYFAPALAKSTLIIYVDGQIKGTVDDLRAKNLTLKAGNATYVKGNFSVKGLPDLDNAFLDLDFDQVYSNKRDLELILNQATGKRNPPLPPIINKFGNINFKGQFSGSRNDFVAYGEFKTRLGFVKSDVNMKIRNGIPYYNGKVTADNFDIADLLDIKGKGFNRTSFTANINGSGFDLNSLSEKVNAKINYFDYNNYRYRNITLNGSIKRQVFNGILTVNDRNIKLNFNGKANLNPQLPEFNFAASIKGANLHILNFTKDTMQVDANIDNNFTGNSLDNIQGQFLVRDIKVTNPDKTYMMDSVFILAEGIGKDRLLALTSDVGDASIKGEYDLNTLPAAFNTIIKKYIPSYQARSFRTKRQNFEFKIDLKNFDYISSLFIPELKIPERGAFSGNFNSQTNTANINGFIKTLVYHDMTFSNIILDQNTSARSLDAIISLDKVEFSENGVYVKNIVVQNSLRNDSLTFNVKLSDKDATNQLDLYGLVEFDTDTLAKLSLLPSDVIIDNQVWKIRDKVKFEFSANETLIDNFELTNNNQLIAINGAISKSNEDNLEVVVQNLSLGSLSQLTKGFGVNLSGTMNGTANLSAILGKPDISSKFAIDSLKYNNTEIGKLEIESDYNNFTQKVEVDAQIYKGSLKTMDIAGNIDINSNTNNLDLNVVLDKSELIIFEPFVKTLVSKLKGQVSSDLKVTGKFRNPQINGDIDFINAGFVINYLQTPYTINDRVTFNNSVINLRDVEIFDPLNNVAVANGSLNLSNPSNPDIRIFIRATNFMALNTTAKDNQLYYGTAFATGNFSFAGTTDALNIKIQAKTESGTVFTIPLNGSSSVGTNDFIIYVSKDSTKNNLEKTNFLKGLTMEFDLTVDENSTANILTEVGNLSGKGDAQLNLKITSLGDFEMRGDYEINEGKFDFTANNLINKTFEIEKGGTIRWTGDPANAEINLNAIYSTRAAIENLYLAAGRSLPDGRRNERVLANAEMNLKGNLLNPDIDFGLEFPNNSRIKSELQGYLDDKDNEAQQVINLIVRNSFNANASTGIDIDGGSLSGSVIEIGVSKLNNVISQSLGIKNLDLNLKSLNEIGVGVNLFNNRLKINTNFVNTSFNNNNNSFSNNIFNSPIDQLSRDFELTYDINKEGNFSSKLFQRPTNRDLFSVNSDLYINGFGLVYTQEYDSFKEFIKQTFGRKEKDTSKEDADEKLKKAKEAIKEEEEERTTN